MLKRKCIFMAFFLVMLLNPMISQSQDHPLLSGMSGFKIQDRDVYEYSGYGRNRKFYCGDQRLCNSKDNLGFDDSGVFVAEGKVTSIRYDFSGKDSKISDMAIFRNYENAIKKIGGSLINYREGSKYAGEFVFFLKRNSKNVWIILDTAFSGPQYNLVIIEESTLEHSVKTGSLEDDIAKKGYATLYINFDHNKSEIKSDGKPIVDEVSGLLKRMPGLRLSIEGHTDDVGDADANQKLSQARARSVVDALVATGIDAKRLQSKGWGSAKPIVDSRAADGRARNRRVELVRLK